jgi:hypothetical protein
MATHSPLQKSKTRRLLLGTVVGLPIASVVASALGQVDLLSSVALLTSSCLALLAILVDTTLAEAAARANESRTFKNDDDAFSTLAPQLESRPPKTVDLLEYSCHGALPLLSKLEELGSTKEIRLLVAHPDAAISLYQRDVRLAEALRALAYRIPAARARKIGLRIRCYSNAPSMRGRLVDGTQLVIGWYTFDDRRLGDPGGKAMAGASNASISVHVDNPCGPDLISTYRRTFDNLWRDADDVGIAWQSHRANLPHLPPKEWFDAVRSARRSNK